MNGWLYASLFILSLPNFMVFLIKLFLTSRSFKIYRKQQNSVKQLFFNKKQINFKRGKILKNFFFFSNKCNIILHVSENIFILKFCFVLLTLIPWVLGLPFYSLELSTMVLVFFKYFVILTCWIIFI